MKNLLLSLLAFAAFFVVSPIDTGPQYSAEIAYEQPTFDIDGLTPNTLDYQAEEGLDAGTAEYRAAGFSNALELPTEVITPKLYWAYLDDYPEAYAPDYQPPNIQHNRPPGNLRS